MLIMELENILLIIGLIALLLIGGLVEVAFLSFLGAFTRRIFGDKKKKIKEYYKENRIYNSILGLIVIIVLFVTVFSLVRLIQLAS
jgi:uncharacterized membrane protein